MTSLSLEDRVRLGIATEQEMDTLGRDAVLAIRTDPERTQFRGSAIRAVDPPKGYDSDRKILRLVASTEDPDFHGSVILVNGANGGKGWLLDHYRAQGEPYLWAHNIGEVRMPIGQGLKTWKTRLEEPRGASKRALVEDVEFFGADDGTDDHFKFSEAVYLLMSGKGTRSGKPVMGSSVGFVPIQGRFVEDDEAQKYGLGRFGIIYEETALLENSATPTPSNPFASVLKTAQGSGVVERSILAELDHMEQMRLLHPAILRDFRKRGILGPEHAAQHLAERLHSRVFYLDETAAEEAPTTLPTDADGVVDLKACREKQAEEDSGEPAEPVTLSEEPQVHPDGGHVVPDEIAQEIVRGLAEARKVEDHAETVRAEATEPDEQGERTLTLSADAVRLVQQAARSADDAFAALSVLSEALDKSTPPDLRSSFGSGDALAAFEERLTARLRAIEERLKAIDSVAVTTPAVAEPVKRATKSLDPDAIIRELRGRS